MKNLCVGEANEGSNLVWVDIKKTSSQLNKCEWVFYLQTEAERAQGAQQCRNGAQGKIINLMELRSGLNENSSL